MTHSSITRDSQRLAQFDGMLTTGALPTRVPVRADEDDDDEDYE